MERRVGRRAKALADLTDPAAWPIERLYFELYAHALLGRPGTEGFLEASVEPWISATADILVRSGADPAWARAEPVSAWPCPGLLLTRWPAATGPASPRPTSTSWSTALAANRGRGRVPRALMTAGRAAATGRPPGSSFQ